MHLPASRCPTPFWPLALRSTPTLKAFALPALFACLACMLAGCDTESASDSGAPSIPAGADVIVIGDSILAFNQGEDAAVADVLATRLGRTVFDASQGGARLSAPEAVNAEDFREDIRQQYVQHHGDWVWVVMDGGGNDLGDECEVETCASVLETLVSADGLSGEFPDFVRTVRANGARVLVMGYPEELQGETSEFTPLLDLLRELDARQQRMAAALDGAYYASAADAVDATNPAHYADAIHPSVEGSRLIGEFLAEAIQVVEREP